MMLGSIDCADPKHYDLEAEVAMLRTRVACLEMDLRNAREEIARLSAFVPKHENKVHRPGMVHGP